MSLQILQRPASEARYCPGAGFDFCAAVRIGDFDNRSWTLRAVDPNQGSLVNIGVPVPKSSGLVSAITDPNYTGGSIYDETDTLRSGTKFSLGFGGWEPTSIVYPEAGWYLEVDITITLTTGLTGCVFSYRYPLTGFVNQFDGDFNANDFHGDFDAAF